LRAIEVGAACPPLEIKACWLAGKFILELYTLSSDQIIDLFSLVTLVLRYIPKTLSILPKTIRSLAPFKNIILTNPHQLSLYFSPFEALTFPIDITITPHFSNLSRKSLAALPNNSVNALFHDFLNHNFPGSQPFFTNGSVSSSAGYTYFFQNFGISSYSNLPSISSSFSTECWAIIQSLICIHQLLIDNLLIISDSISCLLALKSFPINSHVSPLIFKIRVLTFFLTASGYNIRFIWVPAHIGILGNKTANNLAKQLIYFHPVFK